MSCSDNIFKLYAGEITTKRVTVIEPKDKVTDPDVPVDLTGSEVVITCKEDTAQSNAEAVVQASQTSHADGTNGITDIDFDLTNVVSRIKNEGALLVCDVWIIDSAGKRLPQGTFEGEVMASPNKVAGVIDTEDPTISADDGILTVNGDIDTQGGITATGTITSTGDITTGGDVDSVNVTASGTISSGGDISTDGSVTATGDVTASGDVSGFTLTASGSVVSQGDITASGDIYGDNVTATGNVTVDGDISTDGAIDSSYVSLNEQSSDPSLAGAGKTAIWQSDGTGAGDDGDIMAKVYDSAGNSVTRTLIDYDSGSDSGYEFTGGFVDRTTGQSGANDLGSNTQYTAAMASSSAWYRFGFSAARQAANDVAYFPTSSFDSFDQTKGLFGGAHMPEGIENLVDYSFDDSGQSGSYSDAVTSGSLQYNAATGSYDLTGCNVGDLVKVRFSFNAVPQVANSTLEVGLIFMTRDEYDAPTFTFALTTQPIFFGTGSQGVAYLNRVEMSAYIASDEDRNARLLPAIRCNNEILIQPLTTLISIIR